MTNETIKLTFISLLLISTVGGCTTVVTAPIEVAGAVAGAGISMVGAAGGAIVDIATGGDDEEDE